jgi:Ni2+-binding GTPase involved in maturation of urease and hydrogenase
MTTRLILVGGFLGAGKTTLLWEAAQKLGLTGLKVGLVTNDQAPELVDTAFLARGGIEVAEVSGSCFCCNFDGLAEAMSRLRTRAGVDVIIAEPVGSCTDLSATIVQPLKDRLDGRLVVGPLSVMVDPFRLREILNGGTAGLHPSAAYILRTQLEEADIIVVSKADLLARSELDGLMTRTERAFTGADVVSMSVETGEGLDPWLDVVMRRSDGGRRLADVDYDVYAEGEAVLGWLNASFILDGAGSDWEAFARLVLSVMSQRFDGMGASVGHVKLIVDAGDVLVGNLTGAANTLSIRGSAGTGRDARMTLNARVEMPPDVLEDAVREAIDAAARGRINVTPAAWRSLSPGRPQPTHRYLHVVGQA